MKRITIYLLIAIALPFALVCKTEAQPADVVYDHVFMWPGDDNQAGYLTQIAFMISDTDDTLSSNWSIVYDVPADSVRPGGTLDTLRLTFRVADASSIYYVAAYACDEAGNCGWSPVRNFEVPDRVGPLWTLFEVMFIEVLAVE